MNASLTPVTDDQIRDALRREPTTGLATIVADAIAREVAVRPQRRPRALRWPWTGPEPAVVEHLWARRILVVAIVALLVAGLVISIASLGAFLRRPSELRNGSIAIGPPERGVTVLDAAGHVGGSPSAQSAIFLAWSRDGGRLAFWSGGSHSSQSNEPIGWAVVVFDPRTGSLTSVPALGAFDPNGPLQWSNDGRSIAANVLVDGLPAAVIADLQTGTATRLGPADMDVALPTWSNAGDRLAYVAEPRFSDAWELYLADADGAHARKQAIPFPAGFAIRAHQGDTGMAMQTLYPLAWSPDDTRILITASKPDGTSAIFIYRVADGALTALTPPSVDPLLGRWSPDGSRVAFVAYDPQRRLNDLYVIDADGSNLKRVAEDACEFVVWAPDGSRLLYDSGLCDDRATTLEARTVRVDGSDPQVVWSEARDENGAAGNMVSLSWQALKP